MSSLQSSVEKQGQVVDQIIHFKGGIKKTFRGVITATIEQNEFTQFTLTSGRKVFIYTPNVLFFEVFNAD